VSVTRAVTRILSPRPWYEPVTTARAPASRPACVARAGSEASLGRPRARSASAMRSRETTASPVTDASPAATVSARPVPSQASSGRPVTFNAKGDNVNAAIYIYKVQNNKFNLIKEITFDK